MSAIALGNKARIPTKLHKPGYLRSRNRTLYVPSINQKGIHCEGDRFDYVVPWEITKKKHHK